MRLDFNVLWVEDQPSRVLSLGSAIQRRMIEEGFEFRPVKCTSLSEIAQYLAGDVFKDEVDLVLVDWDLGGDTHGEEAIRMVRERFPFKDVIFYSANNTDVGVLRRLAFENGLEGVFCVPRDGLVEEVGGIFDSLIKKVLDLDHMRGIVMGATSDIDYMVRDSLAALHDSLDDAGRKNMVEVALQRINEKVKRFAKKATKLEGQPTLHEILETHVLFSAYDQLLMLSETLESAPFKSRHGTHKLTVVEYINEVVPDRNKLGHRVLTAAGRPGAVVGSGGEEVDVEAMKNLRRKLIELRRAFRNLHLAVRS